MGDVSIELVSFFGTGAVYGAVAASMPFMFGLVVHLIFGLVRSI